MELLKEFFNMIIADDWQWGLVSVDMLLIIAMLFVFKMTLGLYSGVSVRDEISEKDNPAFGIVVASSFLSFFIIMSGASSGGFEVPLLDEIILMLSYGFAGMAMLLVSKIIFDKVSMSQFCIRDELKNQNIAAGIVDSGNLISTALIVFAYMSWVQSDSLLGIEIVAYGWLLSQVALSTVTFIRSKIYRTAHGETLYDAIHKGNVAVAVRFTGYRLSMALAPIVALPHFEFNANEPFYLATMIFLTSMILAMLYVLTTVLIKKIVFNSINFCSEINDQSNIGVAFIEAGIVLGLTILNYGLLM